VSGRPAGDDAGGIVCADVGRDVLDDDRPPVITDADLGLQAQLGAAARRQRREVRSDDAAGKEVRQSDRAGQLRVCHTRPLDGLADRIDDRVRAKRRAEPLTEGVPVDDGDGAGELSRET
jgi:hypothetical protein